MAKRKRNYRRNSDGSVSIGGITYSSGGSSSGSQSSSSSDWTTITFSGKYSAVHNCEEVKENETFFYKIVRDDGIELYTNINELNSDRINYDNLFIKLSDNYYMNVYSYYNFGYRIYPNATYQNYITSLDSRGYIYLTLSSDKSSCTDNLGHSYSIGDFSSEVEIFDSMNNSSVATNPDYPTLKTLGIQEEGNGDNRLSLMIKSDDDFTYTYYAESGVKYELYLVVSAYLTTYIGTDPAKYVIFNYTDSDTVTVTKS